MSFAEDNNYDCYDQEDINNFRKRGKVMATEEKTQIMTPKFRVSFPNITEKNEMSKKFRLVMLFDEGVDISDMKKLAVKCMKKRWPNGKPNGFQNPFKDAGLKEYDGYEDGMIEVAASTGRRPGVVDKKNDLIDLEELDTYLYGGCYARAVVQPYAYDKAGNRGVGFGLQAVQILADGEPFGSSVDARKAFDPLDDDDNESGDDGFGDEF